MDTAVGIKAASATAMTFADAMALDDPVERDTALTAIRDRTPKASRWTQSETLPATREDWARKLRAPMLHHQVEIPARKPHWWSRTIPASSTDDHVILATSRTNSWSPSRSLLPADSGTLGNLARPDETEDHYFTNSFSSIDSAKAGARHVAALDPTYAKSAQIFIRIPDEASKGVRGRIVVENADVFRSGDRWVGSLDLTRPDDGRAGWLTLTRSDSMVEGIGQWNPAKDGYDYHSFRDEGNLALPAFGSAADPLDD